MTTYLASERIEYSKKPGKIASPMVWRKQKNKPPVVIREVNEEWAAKYKYFYTSRGLGEDVYLLESVEVI